MFFGPLQVAYTIHSLTHSLLLLDRNIFAKLDHLFNHSLFCLVNHFSCISQRKHTGSSMKTTTKVLSTINDNVIQFLIVYSSHYNHHHHHCNWIWIWVKQWMVNMAFLSRRMPSLLTADRQLNSLNWWQMLTSTLDFFFVGQKTYASIIFIIL